MNLNTEYEQFTQKAYEQLSKYHHFNIKNVQHNIKLKGRSGCKHQIDVYWEYEKDDVNICSSSLTRAPVAAMNQTTKHQSFCPSFNRLDFKNL